MVQNTTLSAFGVLLTLGLLLSACSLPSAPGVETRATSPTDTRAQNQASEESAPSGTLRAEAAEPDSWTPVFETIRLSNDFYAEGADVGDINGDGVLDLVGGPRWFAGPDFAFGGQLFDAPSYTRDEYSTFFLTFVDDLDADGLADVVAIGNPGAGVEGGSGNAFWYENPGPEALTEDWARHPLFDGLVSNESPAYVDIVGDDARELVFMTDGRLGYAQRGVEPTAPWTFQAISDRRFESPFEHGLGVGDVDGDGLADIIERHGWWQQPGVGGSWVFHEVDFAKGLEPRPANWGGAQMHVFDVDGDGDGDVVTALAAHAYGLSWFEQTESGSFVPHEILPATPGAGNVSQLHALAVGDLNGDGLTDVVTGKRYYAHPSSSPDPGTTDAAVISWFRLDRGETTAFVPQPIDDDSGVGLNFAVRDVNGDGKLDIFVSNKRGTFLHLQR